VEEGPKARGALLRGETLQIRLSDDVELCLVALAISRYAALLKLANS
jgi:hypothetical protein